MRLLVIDTATEALFCRPCGTTVLSMLTLSSCPREHTSTYPAHGAGETYAGGVSLNEIDALAFGAARSFYRRAYRIGIAQGLALGQICR